MAERDGSAGSPLPSSTVILEQPQDLAILSLSKDGGEGEIRTLDAVARILHFECSALDQLCDLSVKHNNRGNYNTIGIILGMDFL
jgi:hypothetical protein